MTDSTETRIDSGYEPQNSPQAASGGPSDGVLTPDAVVPARTPMASLRDALRASTLREPVTLIVPSRAGVSIRYNTNIPAELIDFWQDRSQRKTPGKNDSRLDMARFLGLVLANQCECVLFNDEDQVTSEGKPMTFATKELADMLGYMANQPQSGVAKMYGSDGEMMQAGNRVLAEAGYDDVDLTAENSPTRPSSKSGRTTQ